MTMIGRGYGHFKIRGGMQLAHRLAYELDVGVIPEGMIILHNCDMPGCCNSKHLRLGTYADNSANMIAKGRQAQGSKSGMSKLTESDVSRIRERVAAGERQSDLAAEYGVWGGTLSSIIHRRTWRHVP